ncbi:ATP synthase subunit b, mitochondrial [Bradysia coprophila]|uniref:ATP synthase subunit b, mitochondrial n=1 Tax=Bradysia coprophila TaxID=38358 RepID=UPI00187D83DC|nr:ATP synthase subunit b, mitochondrial [Bradysia coprophila]
MLSRAAILSVQRPIGTVVARTSAASAASSDQLFQRPVRQEPGKVRMGFLPEEWFTFFYKKTGVTGPYTFGVGLATYLCSKEIYVMEHEYYNGLSFAIMIIFAVKKLGPAIAAYCDKEIDQIANDLNQGRIDELASYEEQIKAEKTEQWRADGQVMLMEAKKENVALQLEAAYRERIARVYNEVKRRLDYQVECQTVVRNVNQKHMVNWIVNNVLKSITPDQEKETLNKCISDLGALAAANK